MDPRQLQALLKQAKKAEAYRTLFNMLIHEIRPVIKAMEEAPQDGSFARMRLSSRELNTALETYRHVIEEANELARR